ncbi:MAG: GspH/FimT family pseudopilin [Chromatiaceae bacterium]|jgi:type IV fimbrial biogenesis protein FimT
MRTVPRKRPSQGVTLVELVVAIAIAAIVLTLGIPGFARLIAKSRMTTAINTFVTNLQLARSEAVKLGSRVTLCPVELGSDPLACADSTTWHTGYIVFANPNNADTPDSADQVVRHVQGAAGAPVTITTSTGGKKITYQTDGTSPGSNATYTFCDAYDRIAPRAVIISNTGRPRVSLKKPDGTGLVCS